MKKSKKRNLFLISIFCIIIGLIIAKNIIVKIYKSNYYSEIFHLPITTGKETVKFDTHGGFHGDGDSYIIFSYENDFLEEQIKQDVHWRELPLNENLVELLRYVDESDFDYSRKMIPEVKHGYYYFYNRIENVKNKYNESDVFKKGAFNFTVGVYDIDKNQLHIIEVDT